MAAASIAGAVLVGLLFGMPVNESAAIGSGFGFYSISAVIMRELGGAQLGTIAFLTHMLHEVLAFLVIPFAARHFGRYTAVAAGGATAMDTTLPAIARATDEETVLMAAYIRRGADGTGTCADAADVPAFSRAYDLYELSDGI